MSPTTIVGNIKMEELKRKIEEFKREKNTTEPGSSDYKNRQGKATMENTANKIWK
ncbi:hypothetical protein DPMN_014082 [Dreissena polymorpha]|uniref:Uncharacterized protein n=1 Tax=Dreissena polymorpha TaxID=45954 RepID=A0A9D4N6L6_DREPO|nr:hypothetical protein DPMN_014082 [Dreissena polymorpha]